MKAKFLMPAIILSTSAAALAAPDCAKNPTHPNCSTGPTLEERLETLEARAFDFDFDGDGFSPKGDDCNDADANINPDALEVEGNDVDENCDGSLLAVDLDGDGFSPPQDCDDGDSGIYPGAPELCDDIDNDCDETIDEGFNGTDWDGSQLSIGDSCGTGVCSGGNLQCLTTGDGAACSTDGNSGLEQCNNGADDDCDGLIDEGCP